MSEVTSIVTDAATPKPPRRGGGKRQPLSCLSCRQQKLRCDRRVPCSTCVRYGREARCRQNPAPVRKARVSSLGEQTMPAALDGFEGRVLDEPCAPGPHRRTALAATQGFASLAMLLGLSGDEGGPPTSLPQILAEANREEPLSSWWSFLDPDHRKRLWRQRLIAVLPSQPQCDLLANYYLDHINWILQTIHVPSFRQEYARFWDVNANGGQADLVWLSLVLTVISVSALYIPLEAVEMVGFPRDSIRHLASMWHLASQQALRAGDYEAKPCLTQLQTFSVTQLYWYATNNIETMNSHLGHAVRTAQALNLDRDTEPSACLHDEMRHRLWWDLVDSDMFQTICLDRQPLIRLQQPGVPLPLNCNDQDMTETSVTPKTMDEPTCMSMNVYRAMLFQLLNSHYCSDNGSGFGSYENIRALDDKILELAATFPWYFQLDAQGRPPRIPEPLCEVLTWQNHILRTCMSTQRIRMYRPFLSARVEDAWGNVVKAAEDALVVYRTLRTHRAPTSHQKFLPQAYQVLSVAVTLVALLLVEGTLPIPDVYRQIRDMALDLKMLEDQGCPVPVATHGRQVLLKMLALCDNQVVGSASPEDAQRLVPDIAVILGGERTTRAYIHRLASHSQQQMRTPTTTASPAQEVTGAGQDAAEFSPQSLIDISWSGMLEDLDPAMFLQDDGSLDLLAWDMTGILAEAQSRHDP
ncbi:hypothetical protein GE09DRAFT_976471 [Coniochaeta sp. 2T2.1]|nr:hypothetical protein GE09DRAFT_976471 [Coniochaeta sp. 2T2.1]